MKNVLCENQASERHPPSVVCRAYHRVEEFEVCEWKYWFIYIILNASCLVANFGIATAGTLIFEI